VRVEGEAFWRNAMSDKFVSVDIGEFAGWPFGGTIEASWIDRMMLARAKTTGQDIHRTVRLVKEATAECFQVAVVNRSWPSEPSRQPVERV
jgi:hypothetical protein